MVTFDMVVFDMVAFDISAFLFYMIGRILYNATRKPPIPARHWQNLPRSIFPRAPVVRGAAKP